MICLVCEEPIVFAYMMPMDAVIVRIDGNYGSRVYDPAPDLRNDNHLRAYLCDQCLIVKATNGLIIEVKTTTMITNTETLYDPGTPR